MAARNATESKLISEEAEAERIRCERIRRTFFKRLPARGRAAKEGFKNSRVFTWEFMIERARKGEPDMLRDS